MEDLITAIVGDIVEQIVQMMIQVWNFAKGLLSHAIEKKTAGHKIKMFFQDDHLKYWKYGRFYLVKSLNLSKPYIKLYWKLNKKQKCCQCPFYYMSRGKSIKKMSLHF